MSLVDFHETKAGQRLMTHLGLVIIDWNYTEHQMSVLIWHYLGDMEKGGAITANLGNVSRATILVALAEIAEKDEATKSRVKFAAECFDRLREARNAVAHTMTIEIDQDRIVWNRVAKGDTIKFSRTIISLDDLAKLRDDIARLARFVFQLYMHLRDSGTPLPEIFPLPDKLASLPPLTPMRVQPPPPPSRE